MDSCQLQLKVLKSPKKKNIDSTKLRKQQKETRVKTQKNTARYIYTHKHETPNNPFRASLYTSHALVYISTSTTSTKNTVVILQHKNHLSINLNWAPRRHSAQFPYQPQQPKQDQLPSHHQ